MNENKNNPINPNGNIHHTRYAKGIINNRYILGFGILSYFNSFWSNFNNMPHLLGLRNILL